MQTIRHLLDVKGRDVWSVDPDDSVFTAIERMSEKSVGALLVCRNDDPVGIISERDYARRVILAGKSSKDTKVGDIMTASVVCTSPDRTVEEAMALMTDKRIRHLPILENNRICGMISIGDLVRAVIAEQEFVIEQLEHYIHFG